MKKVIAVITVLVALFIYFWIWVYMPKDYYIFQAFTYGYLFFIPFSMLIWKIITKSKIKNKTILIVFIITLAVFLIIYINYYRGINYLDKQGLL